MFCEGLLHSRGGTRLLAATYDLPTPAHPPITHPHPPTQYTLAASWQPAPSLPLYSKLDFFSLSLSFSPFSLPPFFSAGRSCLCQIQSLLPSRPLSLSLCSSLHLCLLAIISSPAPFLSCPLSLTIPLPLLCASSSQYPSSLLFICPSFSALFTDLLSACSPLFASLLRCDLSPSIFPRAFFSPLFSFHSPFLLHSGCQCFVEALSPQLDIQQGKELKSELWNKGRKGKQKGRGEDVAEEDQMEVVERKYTEHSSRQDGRRQYDWARSRI